MCSYRLLFWSSGEFPIFPHELHVSASLNSRHAEHSGEGEATPPGWSPDFISCDRTVLCGEVHKVIIVCNCHTCACGLREYGSF